MDSTGKQLFPRLVFIHVHEKLHIYLLSTNVLTQEKALRTRANKICLKIFTGLVHHILV